MAEANKKRAARPSLAPEEATELIVTYTEEEMAAFKENMISKDTKKKTATYVRCLQLLYVKKYKSDLNVNTIFKTEALLLSKYTFKIRQATKESKGKEYETASLPRNSAIPVF